MKQTTTGLAILMAAGLALGGCASNSEKQEMADIKALAEQAAADAAEAKTMAAEAMSTAEGAKAKSEETESKIDQMFKKAMYK